MLKLKYVPLYAITALVLTSCGNSSTEKRFTEEKKEGQSSENIANTNTDFDINKVSQALGNFIGKNLNSPGIHFDLESIIKGIRDGAAGKPSPLSDQEYEKAMGQLQQQALTAVSTKNLEAANAFLKENATAEGVVEIIPQKLQYKIIEEGNGPTVEEHGSPQITYVGKYLDGTVFGNSEAAGGPITVPLDQTIQGFSKGIVGMKEGEKRRLFVHPDQGYGTGGQLLPNSLLIFDVEVIKASAPEKEVAMSFHGDVSNFSEGEPGNPGQTNTNEDQPE